MPYIGKSPGKLGVRTRYHYTATGSETSKSGPDDNGLTLKFDDGEYVDVYLNGSLLVAGSDYNTATANTISGLTALASNDILEVVVYDIYSLAKVNSEAQRTVYHKTATGGETSISGTDDGGATITFQANATIDVYLNGVKLKQGADYNTTTANTVGGLTALSAGQLVAITVYEKFVAADMVKKSGDTMTGGLSAPSITSTGSISGSSVTSTGAISGSSVTSNSLNSSGTLQFNTASTERMRITSAGRIEFQTPTNQTGILQDQRLDWRNENNAGIMASIGVHREASTLAPSSLVFRTSANVDTAANNSDGDISEKMRISSQGYITASNQPSFCARLLANTTTAGAKWPTNGTPQHNVGNHWSTSTHRFTCPVAGRYLLLCSGYTNYTTSYGYMNLYINGTNQGAYSRHFNHNGTQQHDGMSMNVIFDLNANDYVEWGRGGGGGGTFDIVNVAAYLLS